MTEQIPIILNADHEPNGDIASGTEFYVREAIEAFFRVRKTQGSEVSKTANLATAILKPESILSGTAPQIIDLLEQDDFTPIDYRIIRLGRLEVREIWRDQGARATLERLDAMTMMSQQSDCILLILRDRKYSGAATAIERLAKLKGPADPSLRQSSHIRAKIDGPPDRMLSYIHAAGTLIEALRELTILFDRRPVYTMLINAQDGPSCVLAAQNAARVLVEKGPRHDLDHLASLERIRHSCCDHDVVDACKRLMHGERGLWPRCADQLAITGRSVNPVDAAVIACRTAVMGDISGIRYGEGGT